MSVVAMNVLLQLSLSAIASHSNSRGELQSTRHVALDLIAASTKQADSRSALRPRNLTSGNTAW
jgi:hypothetical protein